MLRLQSDLVAHCLAALEGRLDQEKAAWDTRAALGVVLAAGGYPGNYTKGLPIGGLPETEATDRKVFHAGTALNPDGVVVTNGGRVLCVTALGGTVREAQQAAYALASQIHWDGMFYRKDIGFRAIHRETAARN